jgi:hypothetical protein
VQMWCRLPHKCVLAQASFACTALFVGSARFDHLLQCLCVARGFRLPHADSGGRAHVCNRRDSSNCAPTSAFAAATAGTGVSGVYSSLRVACGCLRVDSCSSGYPVFGGGKCVNMHAGRDACKQYLWCTYNTCSRCLGAIGHPQLPGMQRVFVVETQSQGVVL